MIDLPPGESNFSGLFITSSDSVLSRPVKVFFEVEGAPIADFDFYFVCSPQGTKENQGP